MQPNKGKSLIILRICNELLRRASRTRNTQLCGRIRAFLADVFPIDERSGLNLMGAYNTDNVTRYDKGREIEEYQRNKD